VSTPLSSAEIPAPDTQRLASLIFELSSQLHAERLHRLALEAALVRAGVLTPASLKETENDSTLRECGLRAVEDSVAGLIRALTERNDVRTPLRPPDLQPSEGD
jgi:hypothetical protein